jgi:hypothetical protein
MEVCIFPIFTASFCCLPLPSVSLKLKLETNSFFHYFIMFSQPQVPYSSPVAVSSYPFLGMMGVGSGLVMTAAYFIYQMRGMSTCTMRISSIMLTFVPDITTIPSLFYSLFDSSHYFLLYINVVASSGRGNIGVEMLLAAAASVLLGFGSLFIMATFDLYV